MDSLKVSSISTSLGIVYYTDIIQENEGVINGY